MNSQKRELERQLKDYPGQLVLALSTYLEPMTVPMFSIGSNGKTPYFHDQRVTYFDLCIAEGGCLIHEREGRSVFIPTTLYVQGVWPGVADDAHRVRTTRVEGRMPIRRKEMCVDHASISLIREGRQFIVGDVPVEKHFDRNLPLLRECLKILGNEEKRMKIQPEPLEKPLPSLEGLSRKDVLRHHHQVLDWILNNP